MSETVRETTETHRETIVRAPNHLGDVVLSLPALRAANADVLILGGLAPLLTLAGLGGRILPLTRGTGGTFAAARALRAARYTRGVLFPPSFSSALIFALGGVAARRGADTNGRRALLTDPVPAASLSAYHRAAQYMVLIGGAPSAPPTPRLDIPAEAQARFRANVRGEALIGVFPGGNASSRRWAPERFAELVRRMAGGVRTVVVFGGPNERELTARVAGSAAIDLGGQTDLAQLAAGIASCDLLVTNDTGPLHLAAAVGTPTVSLWGAGDPRVTGPLGNGNRVLRHPELSCVPCTKNECPLAVKNQCMTLITVDEVEAAIS
jgi:lipopolysaccharide heptosyltransferase II